MKTLEQKQRSNRLRAAKNRAAVKQQGRGYDRVQFLQLAELYGRSCIGCGGWGGYSLVADHVVPLAMGGLHELINIQPLCGYCHRAKAGMATDYRPKGLIEYLAITAGWKPEIGPLRQL